MKNRMENIFNFIDSFIELKYLAIIIILSIIVAGIYTLREKRKLKRWLKSNFMDIKTIRNLDGFQFEDYVADQFRTLGFKVYDTPKSGDFGVDIIVDKDYALQLKNYTNTVGVSAIQEVYAGAAYYDIVPVVLITNYYTDPAIELAEALDIELIDLDDILNWGDSSYSRSFKHTKGFYEKIRTKLIKNLNY